MAHLSGWNKKLCEIKWDLEKIYSRDFFTILLTSLAVTVILKMLEVVVVVDDWHDDDMTYGNKCVSLFITNECEMIMLMGEFDKKTDPVWWLLKYVILILKENLDDPFHRNCSIKIYIWRKNYIK